MFTSYSSLPPSLTKRNVFIILIVFIFIILFYISSSKTNIYSYLSTTPTQQPGLSKAILGRNTWSLLHTIISNYPNKPSEKDKSTILAFFNSFAVLYPCPVCSKHFKEYIIKMPTILDSRDTMQLWLCNLHNNVNKMLNKEIFDCKNLETRWPSELCGCDEEAK